MTISETRIGTDLNNADFPRPQASGAWHRPDHAAPHLGGSFRARKAQVRQPAAHLTCCPCHSICPGHRFAVLDARTLSTHCPPGALPTTALMRTSRAARCAATGSCTRSQASGPAAQASCTLSQTDGWLPSRPWAAQRRTRQTLAWVPRSGRARGRQRCRRDHRERTAYLQGRRRQRRSCRRIRVEKVGKGERERDLTQAYVDRPELCNRARVLIT